MKSKVVKCLEAILWIAFIVISTLLSKRLGELGGIENTAIQSLVLSVMCMYLYYVIKYNESGVEYVNKQNKKMIVVGTVIGIAVVIYFMSMIYFTGCIPHNMLGLYAMSIATLTLILGMTGYIKYVIFLLGLRSMGNSNNVSEGMIEDIKGVRNNYEISFFVCGMAYMTELYTLEKSASMSNSNIIKCIWVSAAIMIVVNYIIFKFIGYKWTKKIQNNVVIESDE